MSEEGERGIERGWTWWVDCRIADQEVVQRGRGLWLVYL